MMITCLIIKTFITYSSVTISVNYLIISLLFGDGDNDVGKFEVFTDKLGEKMYSLRAIKGIFYIFLFAFHYLDDVRSLQLFVFFVRLNQDYAFSLLFKYQFWPIVNLTATNMIHTPNNKCFVVLAFILKKLACVYPIPIKIFRFKCAKSHRYSIH
jgi:hypothetical protein